MGSKIRRVLTIGKSKAGKQRHGNEEAEPQEVVQELRNLARNAWRDGDKQGFFDHQRRLLRFVPDDSGAWFLYGQRLVEVGRSDAAVEPIKNSLDLNPSFVHAIEILTELFRVRDLERASLIEYIDRLETEVVEGRVVGVEALDVLIPAKRVEGVSAIAHRGDDNAKYIAISYLRNVSRATDGQLAELEALAKNPRAEARYNLAIGKTSRALAALQDLEPPEYPTDSLRRAIRRALARDQIAQAEKLLRAYLTARPSDGWAKARVADIEKENAESLQRQAHPTNYQLAKSGFPFSRRRKTPAFEVSTTRALYLLHNSLPYSSAGYATRSHGLLRALSQEWDVTAVTRLGFPFDTPGNDHLATVPADESIDDVHYHRLSTEYGVFQKNPITEYVKRYSGALAEYAGKEHPFVLHAASNHWNGLTAVEAARKLGIKSVYEVRGLWEVTRASRNPEWGHGGMYRYMARMEADAASAADHVIAITAGLRDEMISRGVNPDKISLVPNGVDTSRFQPLERDTELEAELGLQGKTVIGYVGSLLDYEGIDLLIEAAYELSQQRSDFRVLIVGDGAERERFETLAEELHVKDRVVVFTGRVPHEEVERYYSLVDIAPFPRLPLPVCELVSPLKPFEAMAMGKAVIASDVGALREIVQPEKTGLVHQKGSSTSLAREIARLLENPEFTFRIGKEARQWVVAERDWRHLADRVSKVYEELGGATKLKGLQE